MKKPVYFVKNQTVYDQYLGVGTVINDKYSKEHPVLVKFVKSGTSICYTFDGRLEPDREIKLSQKPIPEIVNKPLCLFKEGDLVLGYNLAISNWCLGKFVKMVGVNKDKFLIKINSVEWEYHKCIPYGEIPENYQNK